MNFDPSLPDDSRRNFVKKSLAASIIAAQPTILAGLIRAQGGGGGTGTTDPWGGTEPVGTTDPWGSTGPYNTTDQFQTTDTETTTNETTEVLEPALVKSDVPEDFLNEDGVCVIKLKSSSFGSVSVEEDKGGTPKKWEVRFQGKLYWLFEAELKIPEPARDNSGTRIPFRIECFKCTATNIKLSLMLEHSDGATTSYESSIQKELNDQLGSSFANGEQSFIKAPDLISGVTGTAKELDDTNKTAVIESDTPNPPQATPEGQSLRATLSASVEPWDATDSPSKVVTWKLSPTAGPALDDGTKNLLKQAAERAVTRTDHSLRTFSLPEFTFGEPPLPTQSGTAGKLKKSKIQNGGACQNDTVE